MLVQIGAKDQNLHIIKIQKLKYIKQLIAKIKNLQIQVNRTFRTVLL